MSILSIFKTLNKIINIQKLLLVLLVFLFFLIIFKPVQRNIFNFPLRDEEDNMITGTWILEGKKLYGDIFFQRQPIATVASGVIQKITKPNSIYLLIKRHREFIYFYSFLWLVLITLRFGLKGFSAGITLELVKFSLLGNLFHAESLVMYPTIYIMGILYGAVKNKKASILDLNTLPITGLFILFSRETLAPFIAFIFVLTYLNLKKHQKKLLITSTLISLVFYLVLFMPFVSYSGFLKNSLVVNILDFIPSEATYSWYYGLISIFFLPIKILFTPNEGFFLITKTISALYIFSLIFFVKLKKPQYLLLGFFLLAALNFRPAEFATFSEGRKFLPWFSALVWITILNIEIITTGLKKLLPKVGFYLALATIFIVLILPFGIKEFSLRPDTYGMWYINYSPYFDYGQTIKQLSDKGDTMLAIPQEPLIYWQSELFSSSPYFFTLSYMHKRPRVFEKVKAKLESNPPDFFYIEGNDDLKLKIASILEDYIIVFQNNKPSKLLINKNKLPNITQEKWDSVARYGFIKPQ